MKHKSKRKGIDKTAPRCPYCGSHTILRSADGIYRENSRNEMLYVCKNYPSCDSYVRVQRGTNIPLGTVANRELRELRAEAHRHFDKLYSTGLDPLGLFTSEVCVLDRLCANSIHGTHPSSGKFHSGCSDFR